MNTPPVEIVTNHISTSPIGDTPHVTPSIFNAQTLETQQKTLPLQHSVPILQQQQYHQVMQQQPQAIQQTQRAYQNPEQQTQSFSDPYSNMQSRGSKLFVRNLASQTTSDQVWQAFSRHGLLDEGIYSL